MRLEEDAPIRQGLPWAPTMQEHSLFSTPSPAFTVCRLFDDGHSDQREIIPHCGFDLHFLMLGGIEGRRRRGRQRLR